VKNVQARIQITVDFSDESDCQWLRDRLVNAVQETIDQHREEGRIDGETEVDYEQLDI